MGGKVVEDGKNGELESVVLGRGVGRTKGRGGGGRGDRGWAERKRDGEGDIGL